MGQQPLSTPLVKGDWAAAPRQGESPGEILCWLKRVVLPPALRVGALEALLPFPNLFPLGGILDFKGGGGGGGRGRKAAK